MRISREDKDSSVTGRAHRVLVPGILLCQQSGSLVDACPRLTLERGEMWLGRGGRCTCCPALTSEFGAPASVSGEVHTRRSRGQTESRSPATAGSVVRKKDLVPAFVHTGGDERRHPPARFSARVAGSLHSIATAGIDSGSGSTVMYVHVCSNRCRNSIVLEKTFDGNQACRAVSRVYKVVKFTPLRPLL